MLGEFAFGIGAVVDDQVGAVDQAQDVFVRPARHVLGVGDVADGLAGMFDPISGGAVGMVERLRSDPDVGKQLEVRAG